LDANGEWHLNPIDFATFLEKENILWMLESLGLDESGKVFFSTANSFSYAFGPNRQCLDV
jgi:hypothetical protein